MHGRIVLAQILKAPGLILCVVDDVRNEASFEERCAALEHQITPFEAVFLTVACEFLKEVLPLEPAFHFIDVVEAVQLFAVLIGK